MVYFKYKTSFKNAKGITTLVEKQQVTDIFDKDNLIKHIAKGDNVYCFIDPYSVEINDTIKLDWDLTEEGAMAKFYNSQENI